MTGVEALIRWIEPDGTMVPPLEFIPLAEELGLIEQIGDWVVREIAYQVTAWKELDIDLEVGFNLSPRQFWQPDLAERIVREIRVSGIDPSRVLVEVTESSAMMDPDRAQRDPGRAERPGLRDRDRRLRDRLLVAVAPARDAGAGPEDRPVVRERRAPGPAVGLDRHRVPRARARARDDDPRRGDRDGRGARVPARARLQPWARASTSPSRCRPRRSSPTRSAASRPRVALGAAS